MFGGDSWEDEKIIIIREVNHKGHKEGRKVHEEILKDQ